MTNTRRWFFTGAALLGTLLAPPTAAEPNPTKQQLDQARKAVEKVVEEAKQNKSQGETSERMSPSHPHYASGYWAIGEDYYKGTCTKAEMEARVAKMHENRSERRKAHLEGILSRWGARLLSHPSARDELRVHARREAQTARALFLAHTDPSVKDRAPLIARLEAIIDQEATRHDNAMRALESAPPAASTSAPTAPAPSAAAAAGGK